LVDKERVRSLIAQPGLKKTERLYLLLAIEPQNAKTEAAIKSLGAELGLPEIERWAVSILLRRAKKYVTKLQKGWALTLDGRHHVEQVFDLKKKVSPASSAAAHLRSLLLKLKDANCRAFLDEAIQCMEASPPLCRAAIVLTWVGAVSLLQSHVVKQRLSDFNTEASKRNPKWRAATTEDDLSNMKEFHFLEILEAISVVGKSVQRVLADCLTVRNGCGHPNSMAVGETKVASHVEDLILNVFTKFNADGTKV
jgi:hypothetical protein